MPETVLICIQGAGYFTIEMHRNTVEPQCSTTTPGLMEIRSRNPFSLLCQFGCNACKTVKFRIAGIFSTAPFRFIQKRDKDSPRLEREQKINSQKDIYNEGHLINAVQ